MPYVTASGSRIYYEVAGRGFPVLLHHGFAQTLESWRDAGWVDALAPVAQVVMFDILGHGRSDCPHEIDAYRMDRRVAGAMAVAEDAGIKLFDMFGFSLGGRVAFALALEHPERVRGVIVGGMHARATRLTRSGVERRARILRNGSAKALRRALGMNRNGAEHLPDPDPEAIALSDEGLLDWPGVADGLPQFGPPTLMFAGERDRLYPWAEADARRLRDGRFHRCEDAGHVESFSRSGLAAPRVLEFLRELSTAGME